MPADGMLSINGEAVQALAENYPYAPPLPIPGWQIEGVGASGCDRRLTQEKERLQPTRYDMGAFRLTRAQNGDLTITGGNGITVTLFQTGLGESSTSAGFGSAGGNKTTAETNAPQGGGAVKDGQVFVETGFIVQLVEPWVVTAGATNLLSPRTFPHWLAFPNTGYADKIMRAFADALSFEVQHGDNACKYNLASPSLWAQSGGVAQVSTSGAQSIGGQFWFLATPDVSGAKTDATQLNVTVTLNHSLVIPSLAANPTVADLDVVFAFRIHAVGFPICVKVSPNGTCAPTVPRDEVSKMIDDRIARMEKMMLRAMGGGGSQQLTQGGKE